MYRVVKLSFTARCTRSLISINPYLIMKKRLLKYFLGVLTVFMLPGLVLAIDFANFTLSTPETERTLILPQRADKSPVVYLGSSIDPKTKERVEGYAFIHYLRGGNAAKPPKASSCYTYLSSGAKWRGVEPWVVNPSNTKGLDSSFVLANLAGDIAKWEDAADGIVGGGVSVDILGGGSSINDVLVADMISPDDKNEVYFADVSSSGAIAVTIVWGIFGGPPSQRKLVEWDQVYDDVDFDWSASGEARKMDFENIATHELGHSVGMGDLYNSSCSLETMYGYASEGEINKRDLHTGDIAGINKLY
ncbi:MAG: hypothetical protein UV58_C0010G0026 [Candidatus Wolfebacteria bacterium GW2011_GWC1_43_10]|uniref:Peptidase M10 metallopeptidase domain-containing protein n=1 Tax=Candidatus Wolfebacteria bacterium GW2011_GWC1_43_10 TaxID=1619011 RepID=A0A0G1EH90_9BACT|nr:MAG: hypothetical protein UV58_C0010G0026 [Candidatus Wolfebacteria bacterium GW2011_GWC1_43_10]